MALHRPRNFFLLHAHVTGKKEISKISTSLCWTLSKISEHSNFTRYLDYLLYDTRIPDSVVLFYTVLFNKIRILMLGRSNSTHSSGRQNTCPPESAAKTQGNLLAHAYACTSALGKVRCNQPAWLFGSWPRLLTVQNSPGGHKPEELLDLTSRR